MDLVALNPTFEKRVTALGVGRWGGGVVKTGGVKRFGNLVLVWLVLDGAALAVAGGVRSQRPKG